jgi:hypothetical protein
MSFNTPEEFLDSLNKWFNGLIALPLLAVAYGYLEIFSGGLTGVFIIDIYATGVIIFLLLAYAVFITRSYKILISNISKDDLLAERLLDYFEVSKSFFLKIFVVSIISVSGLYITGSVAFAGFYAFLLFLLSIYRPSLLTVANKLGLKGDEKNAFLKNSKTVIN